MHKGAEYMKISLLVHSHLPNWVYRERNNGMRSQEEHVLPNRQRVRWLFGKGMISGTAGSVQ